MLNRLGRSSGILQMESSRISEYRNRYFDTTDLKLYLQHHNTMRSRYKVRIRTYPFTNLTFLEIKEKNNRNRTLKSRFPLDKMSPVISPEWFDFIRQYSSVDPDLLVQALDVDFSRITLVDDQMTERLTIDFNFRFGYPNPVRKLDTLVIAEIKQPRFSASSFFQKTLWQEKALDMRISKYCLGIVLGYPGIKYNRFKPRILNLYRITQNPIYREAVYQHGYGH